MSKGEDKIVQILNRARISYNREVIMPRLTGKKGAPLRFDFGIYENRKLRFLIEFDGEQHFHYSSHFNKTKGDFLYRCGCDRKKNEWALRNSIALYRIPFWELDNINTFSDLLNSKFRVTSIYHNDRLIREKFGEK